MLLKAAQAWHDFAMTLKKVSEENIPNFTESIDILAVLIKKELLAIKRC